MSARKTEKRISILDNQKISPRNPEKTESRRKFLKTAGLSAVALGLGIPFFSKRLGFFDQEESEKNKENGITKRENLKNRTKEENVVQINQIEKTKNQKQKGEAEDNTAEVYGDETIKQRLRKIREDLADLYQNSVDEEIELSLKNEKIVFNIDEKTRNWLERSGKMGQLDSVNRVYKVRIREISQKRKVPEEIIKSIITVESGGDHRAVSPDGKDEGLMQIRKGTQKHLGLRDPYHPYKNIDAGSKYLRQLYEEFGSWDLAVAAFNKGPTGLKRMLKEKKNHKELDYVKRVLALAGHIE